MYSIHRAFAHFDNNKTFSSLIYIYHIVKSRFGREAKIWLLLRPVLRFFRACSFSLTVAQPKTAQNLASHTHKKHTQAFKMQSITFASRTVRHFSRNSSLET